MKRILTLVISFSLVTCISCKINGIYDPNPSDGLSTDKRVFFTITFNGKTLTQYGTKSTDIDENNFDKSDVSAEITRDVNANESNIFIAAGGHNGYNGGLNNSTLNASIRINKVGESLGIYTNFVGECSIVVDTTVYNIDKADCTVTITNIDLAYVTGTFGFNLINDNKLLPATGSFKLNNWVSHYF